MTRARLVAIGLQNFQTIAEYQEIRFGRLTFLYGPNSAGKSAILDAIDAGRRLWSDVAVDNWRSGYPYSPWVMGDRPIEDPILHRNWRRSEREEIEDLRLDLELSVPHSLFEPLTPDSLGWDDLVYTASGRCKDNDGNVNIVLRTCFRPAYLTDATIAFAGEDLIRYQGKLSVNVDHPFFKKPRESAWHYLQRAILAAEEGRLFKLADGWLTTDFYVYFSWDRTIDREHTADVAKTNAEDDEFYAQVEHLENDPGFTELADFYSEMQRLLSRIVPPTLDIEKVSASRNIPLRHELTFLLDPDGRVVDDPESYKSLEDFSVPAQGNPLYLPVVSACVVDYFQSLIAKANSRVDGGATFYNVQDTLGGKNALDAVNDALRHHLLADLEHAYQPPAYQLTSNIKILLSPDAFDDLVCGQFHDKHIGSFAAALARLQLVDRNDFKLDLDEVGSGIGYVLPVLVVVHSATRSFIQQPELHLHPALQAALGDVLIESTAYGRAAIIESHSEHLLLRVLRRIRQSSAGRLSGSDLEIAPDGVFVYFFEPTAEGSTKVRRLRISADGDFLDRWPGGFFPERDRELFDE